MKNNSSTKDLKLTNNERLFLETSSIFKPKKYVNFKPLGFKIFTFNAGFKKKLDDILIIIFDQIIDAVAVYSNTSTPSAPIIWDKKNYKGKAKALIVNSGNANAHTGSAGIKIIDKYTNFLSKTINCKKNEILVSSTGVIGELFNPKLIINQILKIQNTKSKNILDAAKSIMTTDTYPKISVINVKIQNKKFKIYGIAKGSGMINPKMGTMLVYIFIEAKLDTKQLKTLIKLSLDSTFNAISVDSDTSTSDTLVLFSLKQKEINLKNKKNFRILSSSLFSLMQDLSMKVIKDGEGLSKLIKVNVNEAKTKNQAKNIAFSIVNSPLVKTAIAGEDANWGRIIMAIGKSQENIIQNNIKLSFGKNNVALNGAVNKNIQLSKLNRYMKNNIIEINVWLKNGKHYFTAYGNDLTNQYVNINAAYRS